MATTRFRFADFEVDEARRELRRSGRSVSVEPKVLDVLLHLVRERDRVVGRDELLRAVWPETAVSSASVARAVREVRRVLGDTGAQQRFVRTAQRHGFQFVAPVKEITPVVLPSMFGREAEIAALRARLERAAQRRGGALVIIGEPGVGKTCLLDACAKVAESAGAHVVRRAEAPIAVRTLARPGDSAVVLVVDDLERLDTASRKSVESAIDVAIGGEPLLVVVALRRRARRDPTVAPILRKALRADPGALVELGPLGRGALAAFAESVLGQVPSPAGVSKLLALTCGHPLYARQVLHAARRSGIALETIEHTAKRAPGLADLVEGQLGDLRAEERSVIEATSVLAEPFTGDLAAEVAGVSTALAADALDAGVEVGILVGSGSGEVSFQHAVVRECIEGALASSRRAAAHHRAVVALERRCGRASDTLDLLARHAVLGASAGGAARAVELARSAAASATQQLRFDVAAKHLQGAIEAEALLPPIATRRRAIWLDLAKSLARDGRLETAAHAFLRADGSGSKGPTSDLRAAFFATAPHLPALVGRFYETLFARHPELTRLFVRNHPRVQRRMFGETLAAVAEHATERGWLEDHLAALGARHAEYGVTAAMYPLVRDAFLDAVAEGSRDGLWPPSVRKAWQRAYDEIARRMLKPRARVTRSRRAHPRASSR